MERDVIEMLKETLEILEKGSYYTKGEQVRLKLPRREMEAVLVFLPEDVEAVCGRKDLKRAHVIGRCRYDCENTDSFTVARSWTSGHEEKKEVLVLNFANPVEPGGGVYRGARAQEEDLCRKSSLLLSLESKAAAPYYDYNRQLHTNMGSHALIVTPKVEIIRDGQGELLEETAIVAVLTCAAPLVAAGKEGMSEEAYRSLVYDRIMGMLKCAAYLGYEELVLGAWGCGAFGNDAGVMSDLFFKALKELDFNGYREKDLFTRITMAVLDRSPGQYNFKEFYRNFAFEAFYRKADKERARAAAREVQERIRESERYLDKIRGCLFGGAVGDALGYPVEFLFEKQIFARFGKDGIRQYVLDEKSGKALISDDTQMTLFTANGILVGETRLKMRGIGSGPSTYIAMAYQDWLQTQEISFAKSRSLLDGPVRKWISWLCDVPQLYACRAPGNTCLDALEQRRMGGQPQKSPVRMDPEDRERGKGFFKRGQATGEQNTGAHNNSKGCGGIMRVAPMGLIRTQDIRELDREGARVAAITHGHSLGYMPAAVLTHILHRIVFPARTSYTGLAGRSMHHRLLRESILEARDTVAEIFHKDVHIKELTDIIDLALRLAENDRSDLENIHQLGEGWVAEETLGIALYCALRHPDDFSEGVIAAVNHKGDSDSTGAVTGNILGALLGYDQIEDKWKKDLEIADVILEMADDLCHGCQMSEYGAYQDPDWMRKYMEMKWKDEREGSKEPDPYRPRAGRWKNQGGLERSARS